jgi:hypothetical protein
VARAAGDHPRRPSRVVAIAARRGSKPTGPGPRARLEPRLAPHAELAHITDWASKLLGAMARMAGLIHLAELVPTGWPQPVGVRHVDAAARLGQYFLAHALATFDRMGADPAVGDARHVLDWALRTGRTSSPDVRRSRRCLGCGSAGSPTSIQLCGRCSTTATSALPRPQVQAERAVRPCHGGRSIPCP